MGTPTELRSTNALCETQPFRADDFGKPSTKGWNSASKSSPLNCKIVTFSRRCLLQKRRAQAHRPSQSPRPQTRPARAHAPRECRCTEQRTVWSSAVPPPYASAPQQRRLQPRGRIPLSVPVRSGRPLTIVFCDDVTWLSSLVVPLCGRLH
jgi:hypothetical protein